MNIPLPNYPYTRTYRFGVEHLEKIARMADTLRKGESEIVREAIEKYYEQITATPTPQPTKDAQ